MKISDLETVLGAVKAQHGDVDVLIDDADTNWSLAVQRLKFDESENALMIGGDYYSSDNPAR